MTKPCGCDEKIICYCRGPQGCDGKRGKQGEQGERGCRGHDGPTGATGATGPRGQNGLRGQMGIGSQGPQGIQGPQGLQGPQGPAGILAGGSAYFYSSGGQSVASASPATYGTANVVFPTIAYNSVGSGVTQTSTAEYTLQIGTYQINWFVRSTPGTAVHITFALANITNSMLIPGTTFSSDLSSVVEQSVNSSVVVVVSSPIIVALHNETGGGSAILSASRADGPDASPVVDATLQFFKIA